MTDKTVIYSVNAIEIAAYDTVTETWGTPVQLRYAGGFQPDPNMAEDEIKSVGAIEAMLSVLESYNGTIPTAGIATDELSIIYGISSSGDSIARTMDIEGGVILPYFGIIAHLPVREGGVMRYGFPYCIATSTLSANVEQNQFMARDFTFKAGRLRKSDGTTLPIGRMNTNAEAPALPTDFDGFFAPAA